RSHHQRRHVAARGRSYRAGLVSRLDSTPAVVPRPYMFDQVRLFPEQAAEIAYRVDALLFFMLIVTGSVALGVYVLIIYFSIRYRRRSALERTPRILGSTKLELFWTATPFFVFLIMFWWGVEIYFTLAQPPANSV